VPGAIIGAAGHLVLRCARDDDAGAIIALVASVWSEYPDKILVAAADMPELLTPATSYADRDGRFWVVEAGQASENQIIGTVALMPSAEPGVVELQKLYVARGIERTGLAASFVSWSNARRASAAPTRSNCGRTSSCSTRIAATSGSAMSVEPN
jgi:N-acetylglutamate synthase-like GNAT family acetyltransferase